MSSWAAQPDLVRAHQKDEFYLQSLHEQCRELASLLFGSRGVRYEREVELLATSAYHGVSSLCDRRTLGQEYCDIRRVTALGTLPSRVTMSGFVLLKVLFPYVYNHVLPSARRIDSEEPTVLQRCYNNLLHIVKKLRPLIDHCSELHIALFYLFGRYLCLSDRVCGLRYLYTRALDMLRPGYQILGVLLLLKFLITIALRIRQHIRSDVATEDSEGASHEPSSDASYEFVSSSSAAVPIDDGIGVGAEAKSVSRVCSLCLGPRENATATDCGHVFCWECICSWCTNKPECPLCRQQLNLANFIALVEYN